MRKSDFWDELLKKIFNSFEVNNEFCVFDIYVEFLQINLPHITAICYVTLKPKLLETTKKNENLCYTCVSEIHFASFSGLLCSIFLLTFKITAFF
jgi:hypothetical protein